MIRSSCQGRGSSAWQEQVRTALRFALYKTSGKRKLWCLVIFAIFIGFGEAEVGDALKSSFGGGNMQATRGGRRFYKSSRKVL